MLKFKKGSQFLEKVLENFPEYTDEISNCWACVGPKLLTEMYEKYQPKNVTLINSQIIFGNRRYRSSLDFVHEDLDVKYKFFSSFSGISANLKQSSSRLCARNCSEWSIINCQSSIFNRKKHFYT
jgi:hypothetical protein